MILSSLRGVLEAISWWRRDCFGGSARRLAVTGVLLLGPVMSQLFVVTRPAPCPWFPIGWGGCSEEDGSAQELIENG